MGGDIRSIKDNPARECERYLGYLKEACPSIAIGLREGLEPLPLDTRSGYLRILAHLVRYAPDGWRYHAVDLDDRSQRRYRTNLRLLGRLEKRPTFCRLKTEFILEQIDCLRGGMEISIGPEQDAYGFATGRMVCLVGHLIRAEAGLSIVPDLPKEEREPEPTAVTPVPSPLRCIPPPPPRLAKVLQLFPKRQP